MLRTLLTVALLAFAVPPGRAATPSFLNDVMPLLTKQGCNQGACHGKGSGQNGFALSLRGYDADADFKRLTRELDGSRIDPAQPERSLLLLKATGTASHEGGKMFGVGSREYAVLRDWVAAGAPGPDKSDASVRKLEILPNDRVMKAGERVPLVAWATYSDGSRRDVTWLTKFETNDAAVAEVTVAGGVSAKRAGATSVRAAYLTEVAVAVVTVPHEREVDASLFAARNNAIDGHVMTKLAQLRVEPSALSGDLEFLRRVHLDAIGTLPTTDEATAFAADPSPDKRAKLIDALLARPEFTDYWTLFLGDLLQNRKERDHDVRGVKGVRQFHDYLRKQVAANRPWNELARDILTASGDSVTNPAVGYYVVTVGEAAPEKSEAAESVAQAFLGTRIGCAKCHNHPLERFTQDDFYHFTAYFSRVKLDRKDSKLGPTTLSVGLKDANQARRPVGVNQPRTNAYLRPQSLDRGTVSLLPGQDPRTKLAAWVTDPSNAAFTGAMVNRVWKHYLGVALVEPVDDLRATNPPSNPALWDELCREFQSSGYDLRQLMRTILNSRTYQLTSSSRPTNATDARFYSHYYARRLSAEVLLDAIGDVTGAPEPIDGYPLGTRVLQVPDPGANSAFLKLFGRSERTTACACERSGDVTMPQLLHLQNNPGFASKLDAATAAVMKQWDALGKDDAKLLDWLFLHALTRAPRPAERDAVAGMLKAGQPRADVYHDLLWALLNSKDFTFNH